MPSGVPISGSQAPPGHGVWVSVGGTGVRVGVRVGSGVSVGVPVGTGVSVGVLLDVAVAVVVWVGVAVRVAVPVGVRVEVDEGVGVTVGVRLGRETSVTPAAQVGPGSPAPPSSDAAVGSVVTSSGVVSVEVGEGLALGVAQSVSIRHSEDRLPHREEAPDPCRSRPPSGNLGQAARSGSDPRWSSPPPAPGLRPSPPCPADLPSGQPGSRRGCT